MPCVCELCNVVLREGCYQCPQCYRFTFKEVSAGQYLGSEGVGEEEGPDDEEGEEEGAEEEVELVSLADVDVEDVERIVTGPWDKVFGGGLAKRSVNLIGGGPGAGKSTLALSIAAAVVAQKKRCLYLSAEEPPAQIAQRCKRLGITKGLSRIKLFDCLSRGIGEHSIEDICEDFEPALIVLDSLKALTSGEENGDAMGLDLCFEIKDYVGEHEGAAIVVNHAVKTGELAGRLEIQHAVDGTFSFVVDEKSGYRVLSSIKNRFGPSPTAMNFLMGERGLSVVSQSVRPPKPPTKRKAKH